MIIDKLSQITGLNKSQLLHYAKTASVRYKTYQIPKRDGGLRTIDQPSKAIKSLQKWLVNVLLKQHPIHHCAKGYIKGSGIKQNAASHIGTKYTLRMDFVDFFPSIQEKHINAFLTENPKSIFGDLDNEDIDFAVKIFTKDGKLTIGAPSSPYLSNVIMYSFDYELDKFCSDNKCIFTRYADDIFISTNVPNNLISAASLIDKISGKYKFANLRTNENKTKYLSRKYLRQITGLVITPDDKISIGRDKKRAIKSNFYSFLQGGLGNEEAEQLIGNLSFVRDVEPEFYSALSRKHGIDPLIRLRLPKN